MEDYTTHIRTKLKKHEIYYPKALTEDSAKRLFGKAFRADIVTIYDKVGNIFYHEYSGIRMKYLKNA